MAARSIAANRSSAKSGGVSKRGGGHQRISGCAKDQKPKSAAAWRGEAIGIVS